MRDRARLIIALCALALGVAHAGLGLALYPTFSLDLLWFVGAGLAMMSVAMSNVLARRESLRDKLVLIAQNAMMVSYFAAAWVLLAAPQVALGGLLFGALLLIRLAELRAQEPLT
jgi:hypothetical protein